MNIRYILLIFCVTLLSREGKAQDEEATSYIFSKEGETIVGGFGGPMVHFGAFNGDFAVITGGGGAVILNRSFFVGGYGAGVATRHEVSIAGDAGTANYDINYGHGGLWTGVVFTPSRAAHFSGSLKIGGGYISYDQIETDSYEKDVEDNPFFVMTPEVGVELNLFPFMKLLTSVGYQYAPGAGTGPVGNDQISTFIGGLTFKFGWFGDK